MRVLCFGAHPDDLETYLGGTLLYLGARGVALRFVLASDGEAGTRQPACGTRVDEQERSLAWFRRHVPEAPPPTMERLRVPDGDLEGHGTRLEEACREASLRFSPDLVFAPSPDDPHPDHAALARAAQAAAEVDWLWLGAEPASASHVVPMTDDELANKEAWMREHGSQIPAPGESRAHLPDGRDIVQRVRAREGHWGRRVGLAWAEPLLRASALEAARSRREQAEAPRLVLELDDFF